MNACKYCKGAKKILMLFNYVDCECVEVFDDTPNYIYEHYIKKLIEKNKILRGPFDGISTCLGDCPFSENTSGGTDRCWLHIDLNLSFADRVAAFNKKYDL